MSQFVPTKSFKIKSTGHPGMSENLRITLLPGIERGRTTALVIALSSGLRDYSAWHEMCILPSASDPSLVSTADL